MKDSAAYPYPRPSHSHSHSSRNTMRTPTRPQHKHHTPRYTLRYRSILPLLLIILCIPIFFYHLAPKYTSATDTLIHSLTSSLGLRPQEATGSFCTKEVGSPRCCAVYLEAEPCVEECRKQHVDRETFAVTKEYDECADVCLATYNGLCKNGSETKTVSEGREEETQTGTHGSRTSIYWGSVQHQEQNH